MENMNVFTDTAVAMAKRLIIDSIWKSANLEGLGTTFSKTEAILNNAPTNTRTEEVLFVVNMKRAWSFLLDHLNYPNNLMFLRQLNLVSGEVLIQGAGALRNIPVQIGGTSWTPQLPQEGIIIADLEAISAIKDYELQALKYFCYVARTQMFIDGNKRVAQLIANKVLIENNVGIFQVDLEYLEEFKTLLISYYETNDDSKIIEFMLKHCIKRVQRGD